MNNFFEWYCKPFSDAEISEYFYVAQYICWNSHEDTSHWNSGKKNLVPTKEAPAAKII